MSRLDALIQPKPEAKKEASKEKEQAEGIQYSLQSPKSKIRYGKLEREVIIRQYQLDDGLPIVSIHDRDAFGSSHVEIRGLRLLETERLRVPARLLQLGLENPELQAQIISHYQKAVSRGLLPAEFLWVLREGFRLAEAYQEDLEEIAGGDSGR